MILATDQPRIHWQTIAPVLAVRNEHEYNAAVKRLNELPEVNSQGVVSEILGGKRQLNVRQIRK